MTKLETAFRNLLMGVTRKQTGTFINSRGQALHTVEFEPQESPQAVLVFHHGYGEHTGRYDYGEAHTHTLLAKQGPLLICHLLCLLIPVVVSEHPSEW